MQLSVALFLAHRISPKFKIPVNFKIACVLLVSLRFNIKYHRKSATSLIRCNWPFIEFWPSLSFDPSSSAFIRCFHFKSLAEFSCSWNFMLHYYRTTVQKRYRIMGYNNPVAIQNYFKIYSKKELESCREDNYALNFNKASGVYHCLNRCTRLL